ncbi:MAG: hypothetical protein GDA38_05340 [Hormoscilla sp. SP12CHS1]|nr:hypothetical protein [Hormoscilla sp. SP12CHS1]
MATLRSNIALLKNNGNTWRENLFFLTIRFFGPFADRSSGRSDRLISGRPQPQDRWQQIGNQSFTISYMRRFMQIFTNKPEQLTLTRSY